MGCSTWSRATTAPARRWSAHPGVAKVSLTGEVGTGKIVMANAAATLKHVTLELGGKSPLIIFDDADLDNAVSAALMANFYTQGEICSNGTRVFVHEEIHDEFLERLVTRTSKMKIGDPMDPDTHVGALISQEHMEKVLGYIEAGKSAGARLVIGGGRPEDPALENGYFVEPTVFDACTDDMSIVQEEIFGPVMAVLTFRDEDDVIARANDTEYRPAPRASSPATCSVPTGWWPASRPGPPGSTTTTSPRSRCPSAATSSPGSAGRTASSPSTTTPRSRACTWRWATSRRRTRTGTIREGEKWLKDSWRARPPW